MQIRLSQANEVAVRIKAAKAKTPVTDEANRLIAIALKLEKK